MRRISAALLLAVTLAAMTGGAAFAADGGVVYSAQSYAPSNQDHRVWMAGHRRGNSSSGARWRRRFQSVLPFSRHYEYSSRRNYRHYGYSSYSDSRDYGYSPYYRYYGGYGSRRGQSFGRH